MTWRTDAGVTGAASFAFASDDGPADRFHIVGTQAELSVPCFGAGPIELRRPGEPHDAAPYKTFDIPNPPHIQQPLIESVVAELHGDGACPSTGRTALRTNAVLDAVLNDYYGGRDDAFWQRPQTWAARNG